MPVETSSSKRSPRNLSLQTVKQPPSTMRTLKRPFTPRPHQLEALHALTTGPLGLAHHDRATAILPSGTGKTLLQWLVAEALHARSVLICLPSLALVQQTIKVWIAQSAARPYHGLVICSDATITSRAQDEDEWQVAAEDLDFPVTTSRTVIQAFLNTSRDQPRVIFCTYQSLPLLSKLISPKQPLDLGIFDEAHHTAGDAGKPFEIGLHNRYIPIRKRLFLTATPRILGHRESRIAQSFVTASMDDPLLYGPQSYALGFNRAIDDGLICPYQVVITVVTPTDLPPSLLRSLHGSGNENTVRAAANLIALAKTMQRYRLKKALTFHHTIRDAALYESLQHHEELAPLLQRIPVSHLSGAMPTDQRLTRLNQFQAHERAILTNARCLQEGVDIPTIDLVGFLSPRRSPIDIIQAIGRALRTAPSKHKGYILLPIYQPSSKETSLEQTLKTTGYDSIWDVIQALADQDEPLKHHLQTIRRSDSPTAISPTLPPFPPQIIIDHPTTHLRKIIRTRVITGVTSIWDERLSQLTQYLAQHHTFPTEHDVPSLYYWMCSQRKLRSKGILSEERQTTLSDLGFIWDTAQEQWNASYTELLQFFKRHNHLRIPKNTLQNHLLVDLRIKHKNGTLPQARIDQLNAIQMVWNPHEQRTQHCDTRMLKLIQQSPEDIKNGGLNPCHPSYSWWQKQRAAYRGNTLSAERQKTLTRLGLSFKPGKPWKKGIQNKSWNRHITLIRTCPIEHGTRLIPRRHPSYVWYIKKRRESTKGILSTQQQQELLALGLQLHARGIATLNAAQQTKVNLALCRTLPLRNNRRTIPKTHHLYDWYLSQRNLFRNGSLSQHVTQSFLTLGLALPIRSMPTWDAHYQSLTTFKRHYGHLYLPMTHSASSWLGTQRTQYHTGKLSPAKKKALTALGIDWHPTTGHQKRINSWNQHFPKLQQFFHRHGHLRIPSIHPSYGWLHTRKIDHKDGSLPTHEQRQLNKIGMHF
ncbi:MAG: Helicase associated domain protein [Nitrospirota bacterium]|nr:Helicase associated domain protein [Nitrospirota bacterium]